MFGAMLEYPINLSRSKNDSFLIYSGLKEPLFCGLRGGRERDDRQEF